MPYKIHTEPRNGYLYITITGENLPDNVKSYLSDVSQLCLHYQCPNVIIVENLVGPGLSTFEIYSLISQSVEKALIFHRIAYVDINTEHNPVNMHFAQDVASNRGVKIQVFATIRGAEEWMENSLK